MTMKKVLMLLMVLAGVLFGQTPQTISAVDSLTRPWNITAYTANDVVNDSTFTRMLRFKHKNIWSNNDSGLVVNKGMGGIIVGATLTVGDSNNIANGYFRLLLFSDTVVNVADNAAWATSAYYNTRFIDYIDFQLTNDGTVNNYATASTAIGFETNTDDRYLYGVLIAKAAFQPVRGQKFIVKLRIVRN